MDINNMNIKEILYTTSKEEEIKVYIIQENLKCLQKRDIMIMQNIEKSAFYGG